jgi:hypothetical protein
MSNIEEEPIEEETIIIGNIDEDPYNADWIKQVGSLKNIDEKQRK